MERERECVLNISAIASSKSCQCVRHWTTTMVHWVLCVEKKGGNFKIAHPKPSRERWVLVRSCKTRLASAGNCKNPAPPTANLAITTVTHTTAAATFAFRFASEEEVGRKWNAPSFCHRVTFTCQCQHELN